MEKVTVPISKVVLERLCSMRYRVRGNNSAYSTAKSIDGAKSTGRGVPPIGAGKLTMIASIDRGL